MSSDYTPDKKTHDSDPAAYDKLQCPAYTMPAGAAIRPSGSNAQDGAAHKSGEKTQEGIVTEVGLPQRGHYFNFEIPR